MKEMKKHYRTTHKSYADKEGIKDTRCKCDSCGKEFARKDYKKRHLDKFPSCRNGKIEGPVDPLDGYGGSLGGQLTTETGN